MSAVSASHHEARRIYFQPISNQEEQELGVKHRNEILAKAEERKSNRLPPEMNPLQLYSVERAVVKGVAIGAGLGATGGAVVGACVAGVGALPGAVVGGVIGGTTGGIIAYRRVKKLNQRLYSEWHAKLSQAHAIDFKRIFNEDNEMINYICPISKDVMAIPASLPCGHIFDLQQLNEWAKTKISQSQPLTCPLHNNTFTVEQIYADPKLAKKINQTYARILRQGTTNIGQRLTPIQAEGIQLLHKDLTGQATSITIGLMNEVMASMNQKKDDELSYDEIEASQQYVNEWFEVMKEGKKAPKSDLEDVDLD